MWALCDKTWVEVIFNHVEWNHFLIVSQNFYSVFGFMAAPPVDLDLTTIFAGGKAAKCPIKGTHTLAIL